MTERQKVSLASAAYLAMTIALCGVRPLWLDEILQLMETRTRSQGEMIRRLPTGHPGHAPLGYLTQQAELRAAGYSLRTARLPSAIFACATVFVVGLLASELRVRRAWVASVLLAAFPLILHYATEGRVYAEALFFSTVASLLYVRLARSHTLRTAAGYALALTGAVYTQPYSVSVGLAHVLWSITMKERRTAILGGAGFTFVIGAFLPWFLCSREAWSVALRTQTHEFNFSLKTPLMIFRELAGAGYWGSGLLLILCALGVRRKDGRHQERSFLLLLLVAPVVAAVGADAIFGYFIASRQFLWVLPGVAVLAAGAVERHGRQGAMLGVLLVMVCVFQSVRYFSGPHEDWEAAARAIREQAEGHRACVAVAPPGSLPLYQFFLPELGHSRCDSSEVVLAVTPYTRWEERASEVAKLTAEGYRQMGEMQVGRSLILRFRLRPQAREDGRDK